MLEISALGSLNIQADGVALGSFESRTVDALLVYLAYTRQPQPRERLAEFFWSERSQAQSLTNLRVALFRLRQRLTPYLLITRKTVALDLQNVILDATELTHGLSQLRPQWSQNQGLSPADAAQLEAILALYHGDFLADLSLYDCPAFEDWKQIEREMLHAQVIEASHHLVTFYIDAGVYPAGITQAARLIELDPYREEARRQLMFLLARTGQHSAALAHYDSFRRLLLDELAIAPSDDTVELAAQIQAGSLLPDLLYQSIAGRVGLTSAEPTQIKNPYKGLRAFQAEDAAGFFGRDGLIADLHATLKQPTDVRFLAIVGPSGSGKSSLIKAGLIPTVLQEGLPGWQRCHVFEMSPGSQPLARLDNGLRKLLAEHSSRLPAEEALSALIEALDLNAEGLIVLIDQLEEVFMLVDDDALRSRFLDLLVKMASDPRGNIWVIVTLRADFYDWPLFYPEFGALVGRATRVVLPLKGSELEQAIVGPALRAGLALEAGLLAQIIADVHEQPGALPLLQYALTELFDLREGYLLTRKGYDQIGGVSGATARRAESLYSTLDPAAQSMVRQAFLRLISLGEDSRYTRRRVSQHELISIEGSADAYQTILDHYGKYRLLTFDRDALSETATVEIAHEAFIEAWTRLKGWLDESRAEMRLHQRIAHAVNDWVESNFHADYLATGARLAQFEAFASTTQIALNEQEQAYIHASQIKHEQAQHDDQRRTQRETTQRLAFEASNLLDQGLSGELPALLAIESLKAEYSPEADAVLLRALERGFIRRQFTAGTLHFVATVFSPDGQLLLTGGHDKTARLWNVETGEMLQTFAPHDADVTEIAFSPDGQQIVTGSYAHAARIWDAQTGIVLRTLSHHAGTVISAAWSADGQLIATGSEDNTACLWHADSGTLLHVLQGHTGAIRSVAFSPDSRLLLTCGDHATRLWNSQTGEFLRELQGHTDIVRSAMFSPTGQRIVTASDDKTARVWDLATGQTLHTLVGHTGSVRKAVFSPDGAYVITASFDKTVRLWNSVTGSEKHILAQHQASVWSVDVSPDGRSIVTGSGGVGDQMAQLWDFRLQTEPLVFRGHTGWVMGVAFSPDGRSAITAGGDKNARLWTIADGEEVQRFVGHEGMIRYVDVAPSGNYILTSSEDQTTRLWEVRSGEEVAHFDSHTGEPTGVSFHPDERYILTANHDHTASLWDVETGSVVRSFVGHSDVVYMVKVSRDGRLLLTTSADKTARLWDLATGECLKILRGHTDIVIGAAFSLDSRFVATTSRDRTARLWDVESVRELRHFSGHTALVRCVDFSPNGDSIITSSEDKTARLWSVETGQLLRVFSGHEAGIWRVVFSPDGNAILTGAADNTARLWRVDYRQVIQWVEAELPRDFTEAERNIYGIPARG